MCECELPEFFTERRRTSKKERRCEECRHPIKPGEEYVLASGKWDGNVQSFDTCLFCDTLRRVFGDDQECCVAFGELFVAMSEAVPDYHAGDDGADAVSAELCRIFGEKPLYDEVTT